MIVLTDLQKFRDQVTVLDIPSLHVKNEIAAMLARLIVVKMFYSSCSSVSCADQWQRDGAGVNPHKIMSIQQNVGVFL
jgi:hypothetical protein